MSWEDVESTFDHTRPEDIIIHLDLARLGELVGRVASETHRLNDLDQFDPHSPEAYRLVIDAWRYVCHMADRAEFTRSVAADLNALAEEVPAAPSITPDHLPSGHLPEFGGAAPLPRRDAPEALNRRLEPPV